MQTFTNQFENVSKATARKFWPKLVACFLEKTVECELQPQNRNTYVPDKEAEIDMADDPQRITCEYAKCTDTDDTKKIQPILTFLAFSNHFQIFPAISNIQI